MHASIPLFLAQAAGGGWSTNLLFFAALFAIMYFVLIRPQQQQQKALQQMLGALKKGDDVVTSGGLIGKIFAVTDKTVTLEVASGVKLRVLKSSIQARGAIGDDVAKTEETAKKEEK